jgi:hypothetical protein
MTTSFPLFALALLCALCICLWLHPASASTARVLASGARVLVSAITVWLVWLFWMAQILDPRASRAEREFTWLYGLCVAPWRPVAQVEAAWRVLQALDAETRAADRAAAPAPRDVG